MNRSRLRAPRIVLALLFALSTVQHGAVGVQLRACSGPAECGGLEPDRLTHADAPLALAAAATRADVDAHRPSHHPRGGDANTRAGTDALFHELTGLLLARAQVSLREFREASTTLQDAAHGTPSAPTRAPPVHS